MVLQASLLELVVVTTQSGKELRHVANGWLQLIPGRGIVILDCPVI
jgi:hypothetical protein